MRVLFVGPQPPPVHGMAAVNAKICEALRQRGVVIIVTNTAPPSLNRSFIARIARLPIIVSALWRVMRSNFGAGDVLYLSVSGGLGQIYESIFVLLGILRGMRVYLHHHSYAYLNARRRITALLCAVAGYRAVHIVLSPDMGRRLHALYKVRRCLPLSNAAFFESGQGLPVKPRQCLRTLGYISNISADKGIFEFLNLMAAVQKLGLLLSGVVAGPFQDKSTERSVRLSLVELPTIAYVGPKYGSDKDSFFSAVDVLIFPTRYVNEAEPLVLYEAMSQGAPVIAYGRGCIPEIITLDCGRLVDPGASFVPAALAQIKKWFVEPEVFESSSHAALQRFVELYNQSQKQWETLLTELIGSGSNTPLISGIAI